MNKIIDFMKKNKKKIGIIALIILSLLLVKKVFFNKKNMVEENIETVTLQKKELENTISTSGVILSDTKTNIFSTQNAPVKEIRVKVGDRVQVGDVLATLDTSQMELDREKAEIGYRSSKETLADSVRDRENSITNAKTSLESAELSLRQQENSTLNAEEDLKKVEEKIKQPFKTENYRYAIDEASANMYNKEENFKAMKLEETEARKKLTYFDDSEFKGDILDKTLLIDRKKDELSDLRKDKKEERRSSKSFNDFNLKNAIEDNESSYKTREEEFGNISKDYENTSKEYEEIIKNPDKTDEEKKAVKDRLDEVKTNKDKAEKDTKNAKTSLDRSKENLNVERREFEKSEQASKDSNIKTLDKGISQLKNEIEDLEREYDKLVAKMEKSKVDVLKQASKDFVKAEKTRAEAELDLILAKNGYKKALEDKEKAIRDYVENNNKELETAERNSVASKNQLDSSNNSLKGAKNSLNESLGKTISTTSTELSKLELEKIDEQIRNGNVVATASGVITQIKAEVGSNPSEALFVIEDLDNVHVKANIKEHNLASVNLGQRVKMTSIASGEEVFNGDVNFISPRAVTAVGSPSVEFEINVKLKEISEKIKPGMNAFLNIILENKEDIFAVPLSAVINEEGKNYIYTLEGEKIPVDLGMKTKTEVEVIGKDLKEGTEIRINGMTTGMPDGGEGGIAI